MNNTPKYDLEERTALFGENVIKFCKSLKVTIYTEPMIKQILRSSTSIGANYLEANGASSKKDFCNKIYICKKEAQETRHWFKMLIVADKNSSEIDVLMDEVQQLAMIFHKIATSSKS
jgi:four helix bundle protein